MELDEEPSSSHAELLEGFERRKRVRALKYILRGLYLNVFCNIKQINTIFTTDLYS